MDAAETAAVVVAAAGLLMVLGLYLLCAFLAWTTGEGSVLRHLAEVISAWRGRR
jgi:hypothetical protein